MRFFQPDLLYDQMKTVQSPGFDGSIEECIRRTASALETTRAGEFDNILGELTIEREWIRRKRPYFKVWPSIAQALCRVRLDVPCQLVEVPEEVIAIRFSETDARFSRIRSAIIGKGVHYLGFPCLYITWGTFARTEAQVACCGGQLNLRLDTKTIEESLTMRWETPFKNQWEHPDIPIDSNDHLITRVSLAVMMLAKDPQLIVPDVLASDREEFDACSNPEIQRRLIDKARKRGVIGWRIGEQYEICPHFRRPHFALFHTGKGRNIPKILPVRGTIVHRTKFTRVPTGHTDDDGIDIEDLESPVKPRT